MSAFIVSQETINRVVHLLDLDSRGKPGSGRDLPDYDRIGQDLWNLNTEAVNFRYAHHNDPQPLRRFVFKRQTYSLCELLKSADCWLYQCSDGAQFENHELYQRVEARQNVIVNHVVRELRAYDAAPWDAPDNPSCEHAPKVKST